MNELEAKTVAISELQLGPIRHARLPKRLIARIHRFSKILKEVEHMSVEQSLDLFRRDLFPERQVAFWELVARVYSEFAKPTDCIERKREIYHAAIDGPCDLKSDSDYKYVTQEELHRIRASHGFPNSMLDKSMKLRAS